MQTIMPYLLILTAYIMGSIPFGVLIAKTKGIDIQNVGSKNIGATNVLRTVGKGAALLTLFGDFLKGMVALMLGRVLIGDVLWEGIVGIAAVIGHIFPIFLTFRGGKGVATSLGVLSVYSPLSLLILIAIWTVVAVLTRYSSLAAITAFILLPIIVLFSDTSTIKIFFAILLSSLIILRHKDNIKRILRGTESKIGEKK